MALHSPRAKGLLLQRPLAVRTHAPKGFGLLNEGNEAFPVQPRFTIDLVFAAANTLDRVLTDMIAAGSNSSNCTTSSARVPAHSFSYRSNEAPVRNTAAASPISLTMPPRLLRWAVFFCIRHPCRFFQSLNNRSAIPW